MNIRSRFSAALLAGALLLGTSACGTQGTASFASPVELTVWTYYNGDQLDSFNRLVEEFNDTVGRERNIEVIASGQGSVNDLETNVMNAAEGKVGRGGDAEYFLRLCRHGVCHRPDGAGRGSRALSR